MGSHARKVANAGMLVGVADTDTDNTARSPQSCSVKILKTNGLLNIYTGIIPDWPTDGQLLQGHGKREPQKTSGGNPRGVYTLRAHGYEIIFSSGGRVEP